MVTVAVHAHHRIAEAVFRHYERLWKPGTLAVNQAYLNNQICATAMPASPCGGGETVLAIAGCSDIAIRRPPSSSRFSAIPKTP